MEPVRELDEDDAQVAGHGQQHLAEVLGLLGAVAVEVETRELGHAFDQARHLVPEALLHLIERGGGVLDDVVEQGGQGERRVGARLEQADQDLADLDHVRDEWLARLAELGPVRAVDEVEAGRDAVAVHAGRALVERCDQSGAQLGMVAAARGSAHPARTPLSLSWRRASPCHSLRIGTNTA